MIDQPPVPDKPSPVTDAPPPVPDAPPPVPDAPPPVPDAPPPVPDAPPPVPDAPSPVTDRPSPDPGSPTAPVEPPPAPAAEAPAPAEEPPAESTDPPAPPYVLGEASPGLEAPPPVTDRPSPDPGSPTAPVEPPPAPAAEAPAPAEEPPAESTDPPAPPYVLGEASPGLEAPSPVTDRPSPDPGSPTAPVEPPPDPAAEAPAPAAEPPAESTDPSAAPPYVLGEASPGLEAPSPVTDRPSPDPGSPTAPVEPPPAPAAEAPAPAAEPPAESTDPSAAPPYVLGEASPDPDAPVVSVPDARAVPLHSAGPAPSPPPGPSAPGPGPSPGPGPGHHPAPPPGPTAAAAAEPPAHVVVVSDPTQWGRADDDGTVWVRTSEGERSVGSYPGAGPPEALAYFGRKFDELVGQLGLLEQRVAAGGVSPQDAETSVKHLREAVTGANAVGDLDALLVRLDELTAAVAVRKARRDAERTAARKRATATKERIVVDAESLSDSTDWKRTGDRLRELLDEWKAAPRLERKVDDALWKRFSHARTAFDKRRRAHFAELEEERGEAATRKEKLIKEAEELSTSKEWGDTAKRYRDLMGQWKAAGRARRDVEDALWARFRAAQDTFFAARSEVFASRDSELAVNLETKRALLVEAEALLPVSDYKSARAAMRTVHERWEAAGHVPRANRDEVENRLRKVDDALRSAEDSAWASSNPEARARAEATVNQLRSSIAGLEKEAASARAAGDERKAAEAEAAAATRLTWLVEAERTLTEFS